MFADAIVRWTARLFVACYLARVCIDVAGRRDPNSQRVARWLWSVGCFVCLIHIATSLHFVHGGSQSAAYDYVLQRTLATTGLPTGIGLFINYAFAGIWLTDCILWWRHFNWPESRIPYWIVQVTFAFLIGQATVVFGPPFWTPVAVIFILTLIALRKTRRWRTSE